MSDHYTPPPAAPAQPYGYAYPRAAAPRPTNGLAVAAMICGIVGLFANAVLLTLIAPILVSIAAVVLGHISLSQLKRRPGTGGRGMAIAGLVTGYIAIGFALLIVVLGILALLAFGAFAIPFLNA